MRTQSLDTSLEIEQIQIAGLRAFAPAKRFASVRNISASMHLAVLQLPDGASDYVRTLSFLGRYYSPTVVTAFRAAIPHPSAWTLSPFDVLAPLEKVSNILDRARVRYALAGTLARAIYGFPRGVSVVEVLVDLDKNRATTLVQTLRREQFILASDWLGGNGKPESIRLLYLQGLVCLELFVPSCPPLDRTVFNRTQRLQLDEQLALISVFAPEECVLQGLVGYLTSDERDDDLYTELLGVLKIQALTLDLGALSRSVTALGGHQVLGQLFEDAGITGAHHVPAPKYS